MKLTKQLRSAILDVYEAFWGGLLNADIELYSGVLDDHYRLIGTTEKEVFFARQDAIDFLKLTADQVAGNIDRRKSKLKIETIDRLVLITDQFDAWVRIENDWTFYGKTRVSTWLKQQPGGWKLVQQHFSFPDTKADEGQSIGLDKITQENLELKEAIKRRTIDLEEKNRALEIETSLEKVRAIAMGMKEPADMLRVCKTISLQLHVLGLHEIRNVQTAIFYEDKGTYMNFEYYARHDKAITTETSYTNHEMHQAFASQMLNGKGEFFSRHITGKKKVADWLNHQKTTNVFIDTFLENEKSVSYYWYSLGQVALGISTYSPLSDEETGLFKRFLNVFELSYRRYLDIEQAVMQAREAKIEAVLEKIRSRSLAMHRSDELKEVMAVMFQRLTELNVMLGTVAIQVADPLTKDCIFWVGNDLQEPAMVTLPYDEKIIKEDNYMKDFWEARNSGKSFFNKVYSFEQKNKYFRYVFDNNDLDTIPMPVREHIMKAQNHVNCVIIENNSALFADSWENQVYSEDKIDVLKRTAKVFDQAYVRFLDLQKAEAQAKEAKIEAALERTRTQSMIMQHSSELDDTLRVFHEQVLRLGIPSAFSFLWLPDEENKRHIFWAAWAEDKATTFGSKAINYPLDRNEPATAQCLVDWKGDEPVVAYHVPPAGVAGYFAAWQELIDGVEQLKPAYFAGGLYYVEAFMKYGCFGVIVKNKLPEDEKKILGRIAIEFERIYRRFLDLQKAEAQAREAQVEAALEKVRSRSLAMHKSDELRDVVAVVFDKLQELNFLLEDGAAIILIFKEDSRDYVQWIADPGHVYVSSFNIPYSGHSLAKDLIEAKESGIDYFSKLYLFEEKNEYLRYLIRNTGYKHLPDEIKTLILESKDYGFSIAFAKNSAILVPTNTGRLLTGNQREIIKRFVKVFEQSYTRFLDLQKAEAQAREASIEASLERVRAKAMAMHKSDDLTMAVTTVFEELDKLDLGTIRCGIGILHEERRSADVWTTAKSDEGMVVQVAGDESMDIHPLLTNAFETWLTGEDSLYELKGDNLIRYYQSLIPTNYSLPDNVQPDTSGTDQLKHYYYKAHFQHGGLFAFRETPFPAEAIAVMKRFAAVFNLTYKRFLDLQKAEAQARESQIQLSLERVRARTMAMQKSDELTEVAELLFSQVKELGIRTCTTGFNVWSDDNNYYTDYITNPQGGFLAPYTIDARSLPVSINRSNARKSGQDFYVNYEEGEALAGSYRGLPSFGEKQFNSILENGFEYPSRQYEHFVFGPKVSLMFITYDAVPEAHDIFKRFGKVFEQTYTRFLDLKNAEAQAREAQIELSLERVRAKTMAMHNSKDVGDTVATMFDEVVKLGIQTIRCGIGIMHDGGEMEIWTAKPDENGNVDLIIGRIDMMMHPLLKGAYTSWQNNIEFYTYDLAGDDLIAYFTAVNNYPGYPIKYDIASLPSKIVHSEFHFSEGTLFVFALEKLTDEASRIFKRLAGVFGQTYRRYLDLKKAEAQAKDAQIEAALERVRSRSMGMQKSEELSEVIQIVYNQFIHLHIPIEHTGFVMDYKTNDNFTMWIADQFGSPSRLTIPYFDSIYYNRFNEAKEKAIDFFTTNLSFEEKNKFYDELFKYVPALPEESKNIIFKAPGFSISTVLLENVALYIESFTGIPFSNEDNTVLVRFGKVFQQAYTRFLDLQKAESQAREAQIEAAMEKVRSRALAMQKPGELVDVATLLRKEMSLLGVEELETSSIYIHHEDSGKTECWYAIKDVNHAEKELVSDYMTLALPETAVGRQMLEFYRSGNKRVSIRMEGEARKEWINYCANHSNVLTGFYGATIPDRTYHLYKFSNGYMGAASPGDISKESWDLLQRATSVFSFACTRFLDLQNAAEREREAQIELALERVRARTLAMQRSDELAETSAVLFKQLIGLGIAPNRLYIGIINNEPGEIEFWITDEDGSKVSTMFSGSAEKNASMHKMYEGWTAQQKSISIDMHGQELEDYFHYLGDELHVPFKGGLEQKRRLQYIAYFSKGFIGMASPEEQPPETTSLLERFAYVFNLTFTRFNDLKIAEAHALQAEEDLVKLQIEKKRAEEALAELRSTQTQLIQAEKMASLGQLTAGIAHEIQNPLNFVNNFSEVSEELIKEMMEEVDKGNIEEVKAIAVDLVQNLGKIYHHGKRADSIVKGMLEHSRSSTGNMEPTDINALADEFLRLSYHGIRAKDKSFNTTIHTDFDSTIGTINIIGQDIGRVLLNLYNNAFYAVNEKATGYKLLAASYEPIVNVNTKRRADHIEIRVADNGNGIPQNIVDKIFQPFFTTKPTGSGTGLGLSLAYDIVKAHGGEIKVKSTENNGSEFIIQLIT